MRVWIVLGVCALVGCGSRTELIVDDAASDGATSDSFVRVDSGVDASDVPAPIDADADAELDVPTPTLCPHDVPANGATCSVVGSVCAYKSVETGPCGKGVWQTATRCERDGWLDVAHCVDFSACPTLPPTEGEGCTSLGLDCFYTSPATCDASSIAQCTGSGWRWVNDCGKRTLDAQPCTLATAFPSAQTLLQASGTIADRAALRAVGTQIVTSYVLTPELGGAESIDRARFQSAVPSMASPITPSPFGPYRGDTMPSIDVSHERLALAWGSSEASLAGAFVALGDFDTTSVPGATRLDTLRTQRADVALVTRANIPDGTFDTFGWVVYRHELTSGDSAFGVSAVAVDALGTPRGAPISMAKERFDPPAPPFDPIHHAWGAVAASPPGFVFAGALAPDASTGTAAVGVWTVDDPEATLLPPPDKFVVGQTIAGAIAALADGTFVVAYVPESAPSTIHVAPKGELSSGGFDVGGPGSLDPAEPHLAAFDDGFVVVWPGISATLPDVVPGVINVSLRDRSGHALGPTFQVAANDLDVRRPISVTFSPTDRTLHLAWTVHTGTGTTRVDRQRVMCNAR